MNTYQDTEGCLTTYFSEPEPQLFASRHSIHFPLPDSDSLNQKVFLTTFNNTKTAFGFEGFGGQFCHLP